MSTGTLGSGGKNNHNEHQFQVLFDCGMEVPMGWFRGSDFRCIANCLGALCKNDGRMASDAVKYGDMRYFISSSFYISLLTQLFIFQGYFGLR